MINLPSSHIAKIAKMNMKMKYNKTPNMESRGYNNMQIPDNIATNIKNTKPIKNAFIKTSLVYSSISLTRASHAYSWSKRYPGLSSGVGNIAVTTSATP